MYELPCKCKGSVGLVHMRCFVRTMLLRAQVGQGATCDVCQARIPTPRTFDVLHYHCLCYNMSFIMLLYLLMATACCVGWVQQFDALPDGERQRSVIQFSAVIVCLQPTLWFFTYIFICLHMALQESKTGGGDAVAVYTHYLSTYGRVVPAV